MLSPAVHTVPSMSTLKGQTHTHTYRVSWLAVHLSVGEPEHYGLHKHKAMQRPGSLQHYWLTWLIMYTLRHERWQILRDGQRQGGTLCIAHQQDRGQPCISKHDQIYEHGISVGKKKKKKVIYDVYHPLLAAGGNCNNNWFCLQRLESGRVEESTKWVCKNPGPVLLEGNIAEKQIVYVCVCVCA